jgi:hypothetical protein
MALIHILKGCVRLRGSHLTGVAVSSPNSRFASSMRRMKSEGSLQQILAESGSDSLARTCDRRAYDKLKDNGRTR